jgi:hypothetical protein
MATYIQIGSTVTVGSGGAATIDFTSIPSTYTDLVVKLSGRGSSAGINVASYISLNGSTSGFTNIYVQGNGSAAASASLARYVGQLPDTTSTGSTFCNNEIYIPNYAGSTNKSFSVDVVQENNTATAGQALVMLVAGIWANTAAITSISISLGTGNFVQHSTATLYGISKS